MTQKLTKKDKLTAIIATLTGAGTDVAIDELVAYCENEIILLDKKAAKAKENAAKKRAEGDELTDAVRAAMSTEEFETIADIAARIDGPDVTASKVTYRLTQLVKNGEAEKQEISIPATETSKARKVQAYRLAQG